MLVTSQLPIQTTKKFYTFWRSLVPLHFEKGSATHDIIPFTRACKYQIAKHYVNDAFGLACAQINLQNQVTRWIPSAFVQSADCIASVPLLFWIAFCCFFISSVLLSHTAPSLLSHGSLHFFPLSIR